MGKGNAGDGFDFFHFQYPQVGLPVVEAIERMIVGAEVLGHPALPANDAVEHPTQYATINCSRLNANANALCGAIRAQPQLRLRSFISTTNWMSSALGPFGPGFRRRFGENSIRYF